VYQFQVEKSVKLLARNLKVYGNKGVFPSRQSKGDLAEDLSDISDAESL
jgi:hypothetical protein